MFHYTRMQTVKYSTQYKERGRKFYQRTHNTDLIIVWLAFFIIVQSRLQPSAFPTRKSIWRGEARIFELKIKNQSPWQSSLPKVKQTPADESERVRHGTLFDLQAFFSDRNDKSATSPDRFFQYPAVWAQEAATAESGALHSCRGRRASFYSRSLSLSRARPRSRTMIRVALVRANFNDFVTPAIPRECWISLSLSLCVRARNIRRSAIGNDFWATRACDIYDRTIARSPICVCVCVCVCVTAKIRGWNFAIFYEFAFIFCLCCLCREINDLFGVAWFMTWAGAENKNQK